MQLNEKQQLFADNFQNGSSGFYVLRGYAGTGKTSLVAHILSQNPHLDALVLAPTAAAVSVLSSKLSGNNLDFKTLSKVTQIPSTVIRAFSQEFKMDKEGVDKFRTLMSNLGIWHESLIDARPRLVYEGGKLRDSGDVNYIPNEDAIRQALISKFSSDQFLEEIAPSFILHEPDTVAHFLRPYDIVVIDEMSMVGEPQMSLIEEAVQILAAERKSSKSTIKVILAGDKGQLPPVNEQLNHFFADENPLAESVVDLETIMRSTDDIARNASLIRNNIPIESIVQLSEGSHIISSNLETFIDQNKDVLKSVDIALSFKNKDVGLLNRSIRNLKGFSGQSVQVGETLMATSNSAKDVYGLTSFSNSDELKVVNVFGQEEALMLVEMQLSSASNSDAVAIASVAQLSGALKSDLIRLITVESKAGVTETVFVKTNFTDWKTPHALKIVSETANELVGLLEGTYRYLDATFGYARTIHKSQGSEWPRTLMFLTSKDIWIMKKNGAAHATSLIYTGYTRAQKSSAIIYQKC